jgi:hypothetical protein
MLSAGVVLAGASAQAPPPGTVRLQARAGFDGHGRVGGWTPVVADVFNESPQPLNGELRVQVTSGPLRGNFSSAPTVYVTPVVVPARSHRRYSLDVRVPTVNSVTKAEVAANGVVEPLVEQDVPLVRVPLGEMFCGVIGRDARNYEFLAALDLPPPVRRARIVPMSPQELPSVGHLLGSIDCLILDGANSTQLRPDQVHALQVWLNGGGLLIAVGGPGWRANLSALPPSLLPVEPLGLSSVESLESIASLAGQPLEQAGPWLVTRSQLRSGTGSGRVLASEEGIPLIVAAKRGDGGVLYVAFDPVAQSLMTWPGQSELWRYFLSHASVDSGTGSALVRPYLRWGRAPRWALADFSHQEKPTNSWVLWTSIATGLAAGGTALAFGAKRRPGAAVGALVGLAVLGGAGSLYMAAQRAEPDVAVRTVSIVRPVALGETAYTRTYVAVWPRREGPYSFQLPPRALPFTLWFPSPRPSDESDIDWTLTAMQTQAAEIRNLVTPMSRLSTFGFDGQAPASATRLDTDLRVDELGQVRGTVTNAMSIPFENAALVIDTRVVWLGTIAPGQSVSIDTSVPPHASAGYIAAQALPNALLGEPPRNQPPSPERDVMDALFTQRFLIRRTELRGPSLIGWLPQPPADLAVQHGAKADVRGEALLIGPAGVRLPAGYVGPVPGSLLTRRDLGGAPTFAPDRDFFSVSPGDSINLQFTLPPMDGPWSVESLLVNLDAVALTVRSRMSVSVDRVSLFNWRSGEWQDWELGGRTAQVPEPERFVSATGDVRLRFHIDNSLSTQVRQVNVTRLDVTPIVRVESG